jgi:hypothetical protein
MEFRKLKASEIDCRVAQLGASWLTLLLYKDARVDMNILDETVGCLNWKKSYSRDNANCTVSIWDDEKQQWISKEDTGTESFSEAEKGLASDSFKRACFNWGIGRELYTAPSIFIIAKKEMTPKGKESEIYKNDKDKLETKTRFYVEYIDYDENSEIRNLVIRDHKNNIRFTQLTKEFEQSLLKLDKAFNDLDEKIKEETYKQFQVDDGNKLTFEQKKKVIEEHKKK